MEMQINAWFVGGPAVHVSESLCRDGERLNQAQLLRTLHHHAVQGIPDQPAICMSPSPGLHEITRQSWMAKRRYIPTGKVDRCAQLSSRASADQPTAMGRHHLDAIVQLANPSRSHEGVVLPTSPAGAQMSPSYTVNGWPQLMRIKGVLCATDTEVGHIWTDVQEAHGKRSLGGSSDLRKRGCSISQTGLGSGPDTA